MQVEEHFSAGGVVYRGSAGAIEIILCGREAPPVWCLPKGTPEAGETPELTALREVREETGLEVALDADLGPIEYWFFTGTVHVHKRVQFFLMTATGGATDQHDPEFDKVAWFAAPQALPSLTYTNEVQVVTRALALLQKREEGGPHASAGQESRPA